MFILISILLQKDEHFMALVCTVFSQLIENVQNRPKNHFKFIHNFPIKPINISLNLTKESEFPNESPKTIIGLNHIIKDSNSRNKRLSAFDIGRVLCSISKSEKVYS